ncbi:hypothetical protein BN1708_020628, partial [Verticillium longisporum]
MPRPRVAQPARPLGLRGRLRQRHTHPDHGGPHQRRRWPLQGQVHPLGRGQRSPRRRRLVPQ